MSVRDRYAPSPTGLQHIGGIRTALFNYLFARSKGGAFILRLEDTDRLRFEGRFVQNLYDTFRWLGLKWDEGPDVGGLAAPYVQSERLDLYKKHAAGLVASGGGYYCFCSTGRLDRLRQDQEAARGDAKGEQASQSGYDRLCRAIPAAEAAGRAEAEPCVIRLKIPLGQTTRFFDHLLGHIEWKNDDVNPDPVLLKSDGFPTYHLANVVDDHLMGVTHILRAQEWLSSVPMHVIMYSNFGWTPPAFCHLPMVMGQDGKKLSKRHGATSIDEFRKGGYLPEALLNYVALLGASYEEGREIYSLEELAARFSLDKLNKAPAIFDYKKLEWYNGQYIRMKTDADLAALCLPFAKEANLFGAGAAAPSEDQMRVFTLAMPLLRERLSFTTEVPQKISYLFSEPEIPPAEEFVPKKLDLAGAAALLQTALPVVPQLAEAPTDEAAENFIKALAAEKNIKLGDLMMPLRVAVTGSRVSPPLFGSLRILGPERSARRVKRALDFLEGSLG